MIITPIPTAHHAVRLFRPHDPAGRWLIEVDGTSQYDTGWHASPFDANIQMTRPLLVALRDALNRELQDVPPPLPVPSMDAGLPVFDDETVQVWQPAIRATEDMPTMVIRQTVPVR